MMQNVNKILQNDDLILKYFSLENDILDVVKMKSAIKKGNEIKETNIHIAYNMTNVSIQAYKFLICWQHKKIKGEIGVIEKKWKNNRN